MKKLLFLLNSLVFLYADGIKEEREQRLQDTYSHYNSEQGTEITGISPENITETDNGTLIISNERVYGEDVSIQTGRNTHRVIIKNVKVRTRGNQQSSGSSSSASLDIKTDDNTKVEIRHVAIDANSERRNVVSNKDVCVGALCIQSGENSDIDINNLDISNTNTHYTATTTNENKGKVCAGALCIQSGDSDIDINNYTVRSDGSNTYESNK